MRNAVTVTIGLLSLGFAGAQVSGPALGPTDLKPLAPAPGLAPAPRPGTSSLDKLKLEREGLSKDRDLTGRDSEVEDPGAVERRMLRERIEDLLKRLKEKKAAPEVKAPPKMPEPRPVIEKKPITDVAKAVDQLSRAIVLYKASDVLAAHDAFTLVEPADLSREDRSFVKYMTAGCLRRLNRLAEASDLYREVANSPDDAFFAECATWQLRSIRWRQDMEKQLTDLQKRREATPPK